MSSRETELLNALKECVESLKGYRRQYDDNQPCDAEKHAEKILSEARQ
jgi:hypothetical protein